jgi:hypothetical protein
MVYINDNAHSFALFEDEKRVCKTPVLSLRSPWTGGLPFSAKTVRKLQNITQKGECHD